jgi:methionyl-tRNA synthetase
MAWRYRQGRLQPAAAASENLVDAGKAALGAYRHAMDACAIHEGAAAAFRLVDATNAFIAETSPWTLANDPGASSRLTQILFDAAEAVRLAAVLLLPMMPSSCGEILRRVGAPEGSATWDRDGRWRGEGERVVTQDGPLWPRKEMGSGKVVVGSIGRSDAGVGHQDREASVEHSIPPDAPATAAQPAPAPAVPGAGDRISIDDFMKIELRVAKVLAAERVPKSTRLLKLQVDAGAEPRTIVAGIAEAYEPEALVGRTVVVVANMKPAKLMGVESNGMILAAGPEGGLPVLVGFDEPPAPGTRVR